GRLLLACAESRANESNGNLWTVRVDPRSGASTASPRRLTNWTDFTGFGDLSATADGRRVAFLRTSFQSDVSVAEVGNGGRQIKAVRRLTEDQNEDRPTSWTPDSAYIIFNSDRTGVTQIYRQRIDSTMAEPLTTGNEPSVTARLSPDRN